MQGIDPHPSLASSIGMFRFMQGVLKIDGSAVGLGVWMFLLLPWVPLHFGRASDDAPFKEARVIFRIVLIGRVSRNTSIHDASGSGAAFPPCIIDMGSKGSLGGSDTSACSQDAYRPSSRESFFFTFFFLEWKMPGTRDGKRTDITGTAYRLGFRLCFFWVSFLFPLFLI